MSRLTLIRVGLVLVVLAVFGRAATGEFVNWDDNTTIARNPRLVPPTAAGLMDHWKQPYNRLYIPVVYTVWWGLASCAQIPGAGGVGTALNPWIFHLANLAVYAGTVLLVFAILRRLVGHDWAAAAGAMLFAVHPLQVEPVAWATGMKDLLMGLFSLGSLWLYIRYAQTTTASERGDRRPGTYYALALACYLLALLCKPAAAAVPLMAAAVDVLLLRRPVRKAALALGPWLLAAVPLAIWTGSMQSGMILPTVPLWQRPLVAADALAFYLYKLVAPVMLALDYGRTPSAIFQNGWVWWTWVVPAAVAGGLLWARQRVLTAAGLLFLLGVLPVLGLTVFSFQFFSTVADRYVYLSMLGPGLALVWLVSRWPGKFTGMLCGTALVALAVASAHQVGYWHDDRVLFNHVLSVNPDSFVAYRALGKVARDDGNLPQAIADLKRATELRPDFQPAHTDLAEYFVEAGMPQAAIGQYRILWRLSGKSAMSYSDRMVMGDMLMRVGRYREAAEQYRSAMELAPGDPAAAAKFEAARRRSSP